MAVAVYHSLDPRGFTYDTRTFFVEYFYKKLKNVSCEYDRWVVETEYMYTRFPFGDIRKFWSLYSPKRERHNDQRNEIGTCVYIRTYSPHCIPDTYYMASLAASVSGIGGDEKHVFLAAGGAEVCVGHRSRGTALRIPELNVRCALARGHSPHISCFSHNPMCIAVHGIIPQEVPKSLLFGSFSLSGKTKLRNF